MMVFEIAAMMVSGKISVAVPGKAYSGPDPAWVPVRFKERVN
jgi:hypothetical protein